MKKIMGLIITTTLLGCGGVELKPDGSASKSKAVDTSFYQHWIHSYEEQNGKKTPNVFRPKGSREFPASRFRMQLAFDQSGQCNYLFLSPTDAHEMRDCVYTKVGKTVYLYDNGGLSLNHLAFTIESVSKDEMRMAYGVATPVLKDKTKKKVVKP